jgi:dihydrolipoamide dehydrogenase
MTMQPCKSVPGLETERFAVADREHFDFVVIGAGPAGSEAALRLAAHGRVALVERGHPGGTCLNRGCIPTKALAAAARKLAMARRGGECGIRLGVPVVDVPALFAGVAATVSSLREEMRFSLQKARVEWLAGEAAVGSDGVIAVTPPDGTPRLLQGGKVLLATGSKAGGLPGIALDGELVVDSWGLISRSVIPASLVVIGGGAIGCELAWIFATLGSSVTIVEIASQLLPGVDRDVAGQLAASFGKGGIVVRLGAAVGGADRRGDGCRVRLAGGEELVAERVLLSVGRIPDLGYLDPAALGIKTEKGRIVVDEYQQTTRPGWYAAGDLTPGPMLAYTATDEGAVAARNMAGERVARAPKAVPLAVYCWPECSQVGDISGPDLVATRSFFRGNARARCEKEAEGLVKLFADRATGVIRGVAIFGPYASELIGEATVLVEQKVTVGRLAGMLHPHPALCEALADAAAKAMARKPGGER